MRSLFKISVFFIGFLLLSQCAPKTGSEKELRSAIEKFNTAFQEGNVELLSSMITDDYSHTNGTSKMIGRDVWLNYLKKRAKDIEAGKIKVLAYTMDELDIQLLQNSAIVTARIQVETQQQDTVVQNAYRVTNIWTFQDGKWKRAGFHDGKIQ